MAKSKSNYEETLNELDELFGKGVMEKASDGIDRVKEWTSSGSLTLDRATGGLGIPKGGKTTCILGKESSGKSTLMQHIIAEENKKGGKCAILDVENSLDLTYASAIGVDLNLLYVVNKERLLKSLGVKDRDTVTAEEWLELGCKLLKSNLFGFVFLDSVPALQPASEVSTGLQGGRIASVAAPLSRAYRAYVNALAKSNSGFVYISQYRINPGGYGNPFVEPGAEAWKYLQDLKIEISKSLDKDTEGVHGLEIKGKITKSKVCIPYKEFNYYIEFGKGIQRWKEVMNLCIEEKIIEKTNNTYSFENEKLGVGLTQVENTLLAREDLMIKLEQKLNEKENKEVSKEDEQELPVTDETIS